MPLRHLIQLYVLFPPIPQPNLSRPPPRQLNVSLTLSEVTHNFPEMDDGLTPTLSSSQNSPGYESFKFVSTLKLLNWKGQLPSRAWRHEEKSSFFLKRKWRQKMIHKTIYKKRWKSISISGGHLGNKVKLDREESAVFSPPPCHWLNFSIHDLNEKESKTRDKKTVSFGWPDFSARRKPSIKLESNLIDNNESRDCWNCSLGWVW